MKKVIDLIGLGEGEETAPIGWARKNQEKPKQVKGEKKNKETKRNKNSPKRVKVDKNKTIKKREKRFRFSFNLILLVVAVVFLIALAKFFWFSFNPKIFLTLRIKQEPLSLQEEVELDISQTSIDINKRIIPARFLEATEEKSQAFKATGVSFEDKKAEGVIRVYNNSDPPTPLTLRESTRFLSSDGGKIFRAMEKVILPAPSKQGGKTTPGLKEVKVVAQEVGDEYNIGPSKFSVPGLAGTNFYYVIWGESKSQMSGGSRKEVPKISGADIENAKTELHKNLTDRALSVMKENAPTGYVLNERAVLEDNFIFACEEPASTTLTTQAGDLSFTCSAKIFLKALSFRLDELRGLALSLLNERKPSGREIRPESLDISLVPKGAITQSGRLLASLIFEVKTYEPLNQQVFLNSILGKNKEQIKQVVADNFPSIANIDFKFLPFWVQKAPSIDEKVVIHLTF